MDGITSTARNSSAQGDAGGEGGIAAFPICGLQQCQEEGWKSLLNHFPAFSPSFASQRNAIGKPPNSPLKSVSAIPSFPSQTPAFWDLEPSLLGPFAPSDASSLPPVPKGASLLCWETGIRGFGNSLQNSPNVTRRSVSAIPCSRADASHHCREPGIPSFGKDLHGGAG
ncbi:uncharacterized protein AAGF69_015195 isoform 1-T1 [Amazona ochrocephala]